MGELETGDPREALAHKEVATRAAAARDLARVGAWDDLPRLLDLAINDRGSSVRIYCAAAAADILARRRGAAGQEPLTAAERRQVLDWMRAVDPGQNPVLVMLLAAIDDDTGIQRLGRLLRDQRSDVRAAAGMALRRMAVSAAAVDHPSLPAFVGEWLEASRTPPDVSVDLARLVGECGWTFLAGAVKGVIAAGRPHADVVAEALDRIAARTDPATYAGLWVSDGLDVFEVRTEPGATSWLVVDGARAWRDGTYAEAVVRGGGIVIGSLELRLVWAPRTGVPQASPALQGEGTTWWKIDGPDLAARADELLAGAPADVWRAVAEWLAGVDAPTAARDRAAALVRAGAFDEAIIELRELAEHKRVIPNVFLWLARALAGSGDSPGALEAIDVFLAKAPKRDAARAEAEALRDALRV